MMVDDFSFNDSAKIMQALMR
ncbi:hypothetical protein EMIT091MI3_90165 [Kosakonia quasisacchari]